MHSKINHEIEKEVAMGDVSKSDQEELTQSVGSQFNPEDW